MDHSEYEAHRRSCEICRGQGGRGGLWAGLAGAAVLALCLGAAFLTVRTTDLEARVKRAEAASVVWKERYLREAGKAPSIAILRLPADAVEIGGSPQWVGLSLASPEAAGEAVLRNGGGAEVCKAATAELVCPAASLPSGSYQLEVREGSGRRAYRFRVVRK